MKKFVINIVFIALCCLHNTVQSARILGFFTSPSKSHVIVYLPIAKALIERGHDVTVVTIMPLPHGTINSPNFHHIQVNSTGMSRSFLKEMIDKPKSASVIFRNVKKMSEMILESANMSLNDPQMKRLMEEEKFDLVLLGYFMNDFQLGLAAHFKCPVIVIFVIQPIGMINEMVGNPMEVSYVPNLFTGRKQPMTFLHRVESVLLRFLEIIMTLFIQYQGEKYYVSNFPPDKYPSYKEVRQNISLVFINHHFSQGPIRPYVPALIEIGGIQIKEKPDPLPKDIKEFMDNDNGHGVIYFSLGSNVQSSDLHDDKLQIIFNVLSKLKQKVLWKWENEEHVPGKSSNIFYKKWLPQDDILAHKNVRLFITHGGLGSVMESKYHGVPMIGIPIFADQFANMNDVVENGYGICLNYEELDEKNFYASIMETLNNRKYKERIENFARLYKDRPQSALQTAVFWTEYVLRYNGAKHLQSPVVHMNFFEYHCLDVFAFLLIVLYLIYKFCVLFFKFVACCFRRKPKNDDKKDK